MYLQNVEIEGIDPSDYPDFVDAYISYAENENGIPLTQEELDNIEYDIIYDYVINALY